MKVRLLKKVRRAARCIVAHKLYVYTIQFGRIIRLEFAHGYSWAFDWMMGERIDPEKENDVRNVLSRVARLLWREKLREKWTAKLRGAK